MTKGTQYKCHRISLAGRREIIPAYNET